MVAKLARVLHFKTNDGNLFISMHDLERIIFFKSMACCAIGGGSRRDKGGKM